MSVRHPERKRLVAAWIVVVAITSIYLVIDESGTDRSTSAAASVAAIALALVKVRIVMRELMDVRHAPRVLRTMTDVLVVVMAAALVGTYLVGRAIA